jgi:uncharacterized RDD family membrane protein YckC
MEVVKNNGEIVYAGFKKRFLAYILDNIFVSIISVIEVTVIRFINLNINILDIPIWLIYFPIMESVIQSTLGKRIMNIKVVGADNNSLSFIKSLKRNIGKLITLFSIILIVFLMTRIVLSSLGLIIIVILLYLTFINLTFVNSIDYKQLVYGQLEKQSWYDKLVEAKVVGEAIDEFR